MSQNQLKSTGIHKWSRPSRQGLVPYTPYGVEPEAIGELRRRDLASPAPFSHRAMLVQSTLSTTDFELPPGFRPYEYHSPRNMHIPVHRIAGIGNGNHLDNFQNGMTFQEVLFESLHGQGITNESLDFLTGEKSKDLEMPHVPFGDDPKTRSKYSLKLSAYGDWFIITGGQQRGIVAMFAIWQRFGTGGLLHNVTVSGLP